MRACFLGQNVCALGYGVALVQTQPMAPVSPANQDEAMPEGAAANSRPYENPMLKELRRRLALP